MDISARAAINKAARELPGSTPRLDAEILAAHLMRISRQDLLLLHLDTPLNQNDWHAIVARRQQQEPIAYITQEKEFWSLSFYVTPDVLIPRPDSETLMDVALRYIPGHAKLNILDLGTGSGCLLLSALTEWKNAFGTGIDFSAPAVRVAQKNARDLHLENRSFFHQGNWHDAHYLPDTHATFDLIFANPPYIEEKAELTKSVAYFEPAQALYAGPDGLADYRILVPKIARLLRENGCAVIEIGSTQAEAVTKIARESGLDTQLFHDLAQNPRCLACTKTSASL